MVGKTFEVTLTQREVDRGHENRDDIFNCTGAIALKKIRDEHFPEYPIVEFGAFAGFILKEEFVYSNGSVELYTEVNMMNVTKAGTFSFEITAELD